jgi:hypothetical protein
MRFVYSDDDFGFFFSRYAIEIDQELYSSIIRNLESRTIEVAVEKLREAEKTTGVEIDRKTSTEDAILFLEARAIQPVPLIVPLRFLALIELQFEQYYRYNEYAKAIQSKAEKIGLSKVLFGDETEDRIELRTLQDTSFETEFGQLVGILSKIKTEFDPKAYKNEMESFIDMIEPEEKFRALNEEQVDLIQILNESANEVASELIARLSKGIKNDQ